MVGYTMEAVCILFGSKPNWKESKNLLSKMTFMDELKVKPLIDDKSRIVYVWIGGPAPPSLGQRLNSSLKFGNLVNSCQFLSFFSQNTNRHHKIRKVHSNPKLTSNIFPTLCAYIYIDEQTLGWAANDAPALILCYVSVRRVYLFFFLAFGIDIA